MLPLLNHLREVHEFGSQRERLHWLSGQQVSWEEFVASVGIGINALYTSRSGGNRWVEQTPLYTLILDDIADMFPDAQFIYMKRDGRSVARSLVDFVKKQEIDAGAATWKRYTESALAFSDSSRGDRMLTVSYESVVRDPVAAMTRILEFVGVPDESDCAAFISDRSPINSSFAGNPADPTVRWHDWTEDQRRQFDAVAGDLLIEAGFTPDRRWIEEGKANGA